MEFRILGPLEVRGEHGPLAVSGAKPRAVLAMLLLNANEPVSVERLAVGLWGEDAPVHAGKTVQMHVSRLRKALGDPDVVATTAAGYQVRVRRGELDVERFAGEVRAARAALDAGEPERAAVAAQAALGVWRGPALADLAFERFAQPEIARLEEERLAAVELRVEAELALGRHAAVLGELQRLAGEHPTREGLACVRMLALYRSGRQTEALDAYRALRSVLVAEVGVEPSPDARRLHDAILRQDTSLDLPDPDPAPVPLAGDARQDGVVVCPFKGLAPFEVGDAPWFFGRERLVSELVARLVGAPLLAVVGPSGSGKSSVVRAGLLPALAGGVVPGSEHWRRVVLRPGEHPLYELQAAVAGAAGAGRLLVVVDQFEETFTSCADEEERRGFIAELARSARGRVVVLVIRADHYGRCAAYPELARLVADHHVLVGAMRQDELRRVVEGPARRAGLRVDPGLADALAADAGREPGALPVLSAALLELWRHREGGRLLLSTYGAMGGVRGAVARHAEDAFARLAEPERRVARAVLLRLVADDGAGGVERRRVPLEDFGGARDTAAARVVSLLTDQRLLTVGSGTVELTHEALLREWPRLRAWVEEDAQGRRLHRHLERTARDWNTTGRDPADLYRGARLAAALEWRRDHDSELSRTESAFLDASRAAEASELELAQRRARRLRGIAVGLFALVLVATVSAALAVVEASRASDARAAAISRSVANESANHLDDDFVLAALLGVEAQRMAPTLEARNAALGALGEFDATHRVLGDHAGGVDALAFAPRTGVLASAGEDGFVRFWNVETRRPAGRPLDTAAGRVASIAFGPAGRVLAVANAFRPTVRLWDVRAGRPLAPTIRTGVRQDLPVVAFSPDGRTIAVGYVFGGLGLWDARTGRERLRLLRGFQPTGSNLIDGVHALAFPSDGRTLISAGTAAQLRLWNLRARRPVARRLLPGDDVDVGGLALAADGRTLAMARSDGTIRVWDARTAHAMGAPLTGHRGAVNDVAFSPDGRTLASAGDDGTVRLWDVHAGRELGQPLRGHAGPVTRVKFSHDGRWLASGGADGTVRLWDSILWSADRSAIARRICDAVRRGLTRAEWSDLMPGEPYHQTCTATGSPA